MINFKNYTFIEPEDDDVEFEEDIESLHSYFECNSSGCGFNCSCCDNEGDCMMCDNRGDNFYCSRCIYNPDF